MNKKSKFMHKFAAGTLAAVFVFSSVGTTVKAAATSMVTVENSIVEMADGTYNTSIELYKETENEVSHANGCFTGNADISVSNNAVTMTVYTQAMTAYGQTAYLSGLMYEASDGNYESATVLTSDESGYPTSLSFPLAKVSEYINIKTVSGTGDAAHINAARIHLDYSTLPGVDDITNSGDDGQRIDNDDEITSADLSSLEDGTYELSVYLWNATQNQASMAGVAVKETATLIVEGDVKKMIVQTQEMSIGGITASLQELKIADSQGNYAAATIETKDATGNPTSFSFTLPHTEEYIVVKVNPHVAIMGNQDIDARLKVDYSTLIKVSSKEIEKDDSQEQTSETEEISVPKTGDSATLPMAGGILFISAIGAIIAGKKRFGI